MALSRVGQERDQRCVVEAQGLGTQVAHVLEVQPLIRVRLYVAGVGGEEKQAALLGDDWLNEAPTRWRAARVQHSPGSSLLVTRVRGHACLASLLRARAGHFAECRPEALQLATPQRGERDRVARLVRVDRLCERGVPFQSEAI